MTAAATVTYVAAIANIVVGLVGFWLGWRMAVRDRRRWAVDLNADTDTDTDTDTDAETDTRR